MYKVYYLICFIILSCYNLPAQNTTIVFRYDDFLLQNDSLNEEVVHLFQKYHIPLVIGVIPCNSNEKIISEPDYRLFPELQRVVNNGTVEIALHGLTHVELAYGEFGNVPYSEQFRRIKKGKYLLDSIFQTNVISFIPPWNAYDANTLSALHENGFKIISADLVSKVLTRSDISYFPHTNCEINQLRRTIETNKEINGLIIVMLHHYDFNTKYSLADLESALSEISKMDSLQFYTFKGLNESGYNTTHNQIQAHWHNNNLLAITLKIKGVLYPLSYIRTIQVLNILIYVIVSVIMFFISQKFFGPKNKSILYWGAFAFLEFFIIIAVYNHFLKIFILLFVVSVLAFLLPMIFSLFYKYKKKVSLLTIKTNR